MKVLIICTVEFHLNGITSVILNYYRNIDKTDMQIDLVVPNKIDKEYLDELERNHSKVFSLPRKEHVLRYQKKLCEIMRSNQYDIVHIHGNSALMFFDVWPAVKTKIPVRIVHSHTTTCTHLRMHKILSFPFHRCYTHGLACGREAGKWLYGDRPFEVLKNGIELNKYRYNEQVREIYRRKINAGNKVVLGHVGNFSEAKNHTFMLDWFQELIRQNQNYMLLLLGDGDLLEEMKKKAFRLGIEKNVLFLGKTAEVENYLQAMDLFVLPSLYEGLPVALIEAQTAGLPCLVSDAVSGEADLTGSVTYIPIDEPEQWVSEIRKQTEVLQTENRLQTSLKWQEKIADAGYDIVRNADRLKELYREYLSRLIT